MSFRSSNSRPFNSSVSASSAAASKFNKNQVKKCKKSNNNNNPYYIPSDSEEESENESVYVSQKQRSVAKVSFSKKNEVKVYEVEVEFIDNFPSLVNDSCSGASFTVDKKIKEKECSNNSSYLAALSKAREDSVKKNALGGIGFGIPIQVSKRPLRPFMNRTSENKEFVGEKKKFNVKTDNWATVDSDSDDE